MSADQASKADTRGELADDPRRQYWEQYTFTVEGVGEREIDTAIENRKREVLVDPDAWTTVDKMMEDRSVPTDSGPVRVIVAQVRVMRMVGKVPWEVAP